MRGSALAQYVVVGIVFAVSYNTGRLRTKSGSQVHDSYLCTY